MPDSGTLIGDLLASAAAHFEASRFELAEAFLKLIPAADTSPWETWRDLGQLYFSLGEFESAGRAFGCAAAHRPDLGDLQVDLARTCLELQDIDNFEAYLLRALRLEPDNRRGLKLLADLHRAIGGYAEAAGLYERLAKAEPDCQEHVLSLALCRALQGAPAEAIEQLRRLSPASLRMDRTASGPGH